MHCAMGLAMIGVGYTLPPFLEGAWGTIFLVDWISVPGPLTKLLAGTEDCT